MNAVHYMFSFQFRLLKGHFGLHKGIFTLCNYLFWAKILNFRKSIQQKILRFSTVN